MSKDPHIYKYEEPIEIRVLPDRKSLLTFQDKIKARKCKCGKIQAYDLGRVA